MDIYSIVLHISQETEVQRGFNVTYPKALPVRGGRTPICPLGQHNTRVLAPRVQCTAFYVKQVRRNAANPITNWRHRAESTVFTVQGKLNTIIYKAMLFSSTNTYSLCLGVLLLTPGKINVRSIPSQEPTWHLRALEETQEALLYKVMGPRSGGKQEGTRDLHGVKKWSGKEVLTQGKSKIHQACGWRCAEITVLAEALREEGRCSHRTADYSLGCLDKEFLILEGTSFEERDDRTPKDIKWINGCK